MSQLHRRDFVKLLGMSFAGSMLDAGLPGQINPGRRPNIVVIVADDLGWNDVSYHGSDIPTPNIDSIVRDGVELNRFYACPMCTPTRAGLLTGRYPYRYGLGNIVILPWRNFGLSTAEQCMPEFFAEEGYSQRACIGKWHLGHMDSKYHPLNRGFTEYYGSYNGAIDYFTHERLGELDWHRNFEPSHDQGYSTDLLSKEAVDFIGRSDQTNPFMLYLSFNAPHFPLQAKEEDLIKFGYKPKGNSDKCEQGYGQRGQGDNERQTYSAMVWAMDRGIGHVLDALEQKGIAQNTIVLFFSDNGGRKGPGSDNSPLTGYKGTVWEGGVRVPAAIRWPERLEAGSRCDDIMGYIDVLPTLMAAANVNAKPKKELDGGNVLPAIEGKSSLSDRVFYLGKKAVVKGKWKLLDGELFDVENDPSESENVADRHPEVVKYLECQLKTFEALDSEVTPPPLGQLEDFKVPTEWEIKKEQRDE